ncbi:MAG: hypothetical protein AAGH57_06135 [Pseudomonadota bacterium]
MRSEQHRQFRQTPNFAAQFQRARVGEQLGFFVWGAPQERPEAGRDTRTMGEAYGPSKRLRLVYTSRLEDGRRKVPVQHSFDWALSSQPTVINMPRASAARYLDYGVYEFFEDVEAAEESAAALDDAGVYLVGQLVQLDEQQLVLVRGVSREGIKSIREELRRYRLDLGLHLPQWSNKAELHAVLQ